MLLRPSSLRFLAVTFLCAIASGCASDYARAVKEDTSSSYRAFLRTEPVGAEAESARSRLEELELAEAQRTHTVLGYKRFLEEFPHGEKAPVARALLETLRWNAALREGTAEAFRRFLHEHPDAAHHAEAESLLAQLDSEARSRETEPGRLKQALVQAPEAERPALAARLDDQTFAAARAQGSGALLRYLADFPAGTHREEAQRELLSRRLEGLLFSGLLDEADREAARSPLLPQMKSWPDRRARAQAERGILNGSGPLVPPTQPDYYLRSVPDLARALTAPDPLDRWQAAEELGAHANVGAIDPLLEALNASKNPRIRATAFESLVRIFEALPADVREHELETRLAAARVSAEGPERIAQVGFLLDLRGRRDEAATEYQRAFDPKLPDPLLLWRWMALRDAQGKPFSAAIAARQLGLWARGVVEELGPEAEGGRLSLAGVRQLCAVAHLVRQAHSALERSAAQEKQFPEDVATFVRESSELRALADARLKDAELALRTQKPQARTCDDREVAIRLEDSVRLRGEALKALEKRLPRVARPVLQRAKEKDPSPYIRQLAAAALTQAHP